MIRLAQVVATFEAEFITMLGDRLSFDSLRALAAIVCRAAAGPVR